jgi:hypothetical protein
MLLQTNMRRNLQSNINKPPTVLHRILQAPNMLQLNIQRLGKSYDMVL